MEVVTTKVLKKFVETVHRKKSMSELLKIMLG